LGKKNIKTSSHQSPVTTKDRSIKRSKSKQQPALRKRKTANWPLTALAGFGMALTLYLSINYWSGATPLYCAEGSPCDIVQQSHWGTFLGLPTAFLGFLTYSLLTYIGFSVRKPEKHWKSAWVVSLVGLGYSVYLAFVSHFVIDALCPYCLVSLTTMVAIFGTINVQRPEGMKSFQITQWVFKTAVFTLLVVGGMHLHYSGFFHPTAAQEDPYLKGLALHLNKEGAAVYGAFW
jgi:uncharacterized membrane protein